MNVCFQIIPDESSYEGDHPCQAQKQPLAGQMKIKPSKSKRVGKARSKGKKSKRGNKKHWRPQQNIKYVQFIKNNIELCKMTRYQKIRAKFNVRMSKAIRTKDPAQCRSHNQKMMLKYGTPEEVVRHMSQDCVSLKKDDSCFVRTEQGQGEHQLQGLKEREMNDIFEVVGEKEEGI